MSRTRCPLRSAPSLADDPLLTCNATAVFAFCRAPPHVQRPWSLLMILCRDPHPQGPDCLRGRSHPPARTVHTWGAANEPETHRWTRPGCAPGSQRAHLEHETWARREPLVQPSAVPQSATAPSATVADGQPTDVGPWCHGHRKPVKQPKEASPHQHVAVRGMGQAPPGCAFCKFTTAGSKHYAHLACWPTSCTWPAHRVSLVPQYAPSRPDFCSHCK